MIFASTRLSFLCEQSTSQSSNNTVWCHMLILMPIGRCWIVYRLRSSSCAVPPEDPWPEDDVDRDLSILLASSKRSCLDSALRTGLTANFRIPHRCLLASFVISYIITEATFFPFTASSIRQEKLAFGLLFLLTFSLISALSLALIHLHGPQLRFTLRQNCSSSFLRQSNLFHLCQKVRGKLAHGDVSRPRIHSKGIPGKTT